MGSNTRSQPVPVCTIYGQTLGTATVSFREDDGATDIQVVQYDGPERGIECFCIVEINQQDLSPRRVLAFENGYFAPVGDDSLDWHFLQPAPQNSPVESPE